MPHIEVYGSRGSMIVPDPNCFSGDVKVKQYFSDNFETVPLMTKYSMNSRGYGISDMADCILTGGGTLRANGNMALHILEIMDAIHKSGGNAVTLTTSCDRPENVEL